MLQVIKQSTFFGSHVTFHMVNVDILVKAVSANLFMSKAKLELEKI